MKKIAVISALDSEAELIVGALKNNKLKDHNGVKVYTGEILGNTVISSVCGVGKVNAAIRTQKIIDEYSPDVIINTGIAGSLCDKASHLDVVVSDEVFYHDFDLDLFK